MVFSLWQQDEICKIENCLNVDLELKIPLKIRNIKLGNNALCCAVKSQNQWNFMKFVHDSGMKGKQRERNMKKERRSKKEIVKNK